MTGAYAGVGAPNWGWDAGARVVEGGCAPKIKII